MSRISALLVFALVPLACERAPTRFHGWGFSLVPPEALQLEVVTPLPDVATYRLISGDGRIVFQIGVASQMPAEYPEHRPATRILLGDEEGMESRWDSGELRGREIVLRGDLPGRPSLELYIRYEGADRTLAARLDRALATLRREDPALTYPVPIPYPWPARAKRSLEAELWKSLVVSQSIRQTLSLRDPWRESAFDALAPPARVEVAAIALVQETPDEYWANLVSRDDKSFEVAFRAAWAAPTAPMTGAYLLLLERLSRRDASWTGRVLALTELVRSKANDGPVRQAADSVVGTIRDHPRTK